MGALIGVVTFAATLLMAPALANGVLVGVVLTVLSLLVRQMKPHAVLLGRMDDGSLSDMKAHGLPPISRHFATMRYDGSLDFLNAAHFEEAILLAHAEFPEAKTILVIGNGINSIDASGEEKIREIARYLRAVNVTLAFSSLKQPVREKFFRAELLHLLGEENLFKTRESAIEVLEARYANIANPAEASEDDISITPPVAT